MTRDQIIEQLGTVLQESSTSTKVDWGTVDASTEIDALGFDSLTILDLIFDIEESFGVEVPAEDIVDVKTVGGLAAYLEKRLAEASA